MLSHDLQTHSLLVDADLRNPALSRWFGLNEGRGLSDYLAAGAGIPELLTKTSIDKLTILSSGSSQANPVELIGSKQMESLVSEMRERYSDRYIIFDSSPLLATTEPSVLSRIVDGIILVIRAGVTPRETVQQALATLDREKFSGSFSMNSSSNRGASPSATSARPSTTIGTRTSKKPPGRLPEKLAKPLPVFQKGGLI